MTTRTSVKHVSGYCYSGMSVVIDSITALPIRKAHTWTPNRPCSLMHDSALGIKSLKMTDKKPPAAAPERTVSNSPNEERVRVNATPTKMLEDDKKLSASARWFEYPACFRMKNSEISCTSS